MSDEDEGGSRRSARRRLTLTFERRPLSLPGEEPERAETELELPDAPEASPSADAADGWERQRPRLTPSPFRPPSASSIPALDGDGGGALDLVDRRSRPATATDPHVEMSDRFALGDYTTALCAADLILGRDPDDATAQTIAAASRERLEQLYRSRLGPISQVPRLAVDGSEVRWLGLDARAGFVLSRVDGTHSIADIIDITGMPPLEVLRTMSELLDAGAIVLA